MNVRPGFTRALSMNSRMLIRDGVLEATDALTSETVLNSITFANFSSAEEKRFKAYLYHMSPDMLTNLVRYMTGQDNIITGVTRISVSLHDGIDAAQAFQDMKDPEDSQFISYEEA